MQLLHWTSPKPCFKFVLENLDFIEPFIWKQISKNYSSCLYLDETYKKIFKEVWKISILTQNLKSCWISKNYDLDGNRWYPFEIEEMLHPLG